MRPSRGGGVRPARLSETAMGGERELGSRLSSSRCFASRGLCAQARSASGVGARPNFLRGAVRKKRGLAKGVTIPLAAFFAYFLSHHRK